MSPMNHKHRFLCTVLFSCASLLGACNDSSSSTSPKADGKPAEKSAEQPTKQVAEKVSPKEATESKSVQPSEQATEEAKNYPPELLDPEKANLTAPDQYTVKLETSEGDILIDVERDWAPKGADRFYNLVKFGYYNDVAFFRVIKGFMAQVGIHGDPLINRAWNRARIEDDPVKLSNTRGTVSFAMAGKDTRTTQIFINFGDNSSLDGQGFSAFGKVRDMAAVDKLYSGYGEGAPRGRGPNQGHVQNSGNTYLRAQFPELDYIKSATIVEEKPPADKK